MKVLGFTRRVVIDTNVLVSALLTPNGPSADFIGDVLDEKYEVIVTQSILEEYADVLNRPRFQLRPEMISFFLNWFINHALFSASCGFGLRSAPVGAKPRSPGSRAPRRERQKTAENQGF